MAVVEVAAFTSAEVSDDYDACALVLTRAVSGAAVLVTQQEEIVGLAVPAGLIPATRIKPRAGPIFRSATGQVELENEAGRCGKGNVQLLVASPALLHSLNHFDPSLNVTPFDANFGGWPSARSLVRAFGQAFPQMAAPLDDHAVGAMQAPHDEDAFATGEDQYGDEEWGEWEVNYEHVGVEPAAAAAPNGGPVLPFAEVPGPATPPASNYGPLVAAGAGRGRGRGRGVPPGGGPHAAAPAGRGAAPAQLGPPAAPCIPGLDPTVVAAARQAGIPDEDLNAFGQILGARGRGSPLPPPPPGQLPHAGAAGAAAAPAGGEEGIQRLISAMTDMFESMPGRRGAQGRDLLDTALASQSGSGGGDAVASRRGAVGAVALRRAVYETPAYFSGHVDSRLRAAFPSRALAGQEPLMREYVEHRARLSDHQPTISWIWSTAGARDALRAGRTEEALARLDLMMIAGEQVSIDRGSWLVARELLWEDDPPWHAFSQARPADPLRSPHSFLADPRWCEVAISRLRELDDWAERRRRLTTRPPPTIPYTGGRGGGAPPPAVEQEEGADQADQGTGRARGGGRRGRRGR